MTEPFVEIDSLSKIFSPKQPPALKNINAVFPRGEMIGLAGPDGAGKTTLIRLIAGLLLPTTGKIAVGGYSTIDEAESIHHITGYMPQKFGLYEDLTVIQNLRLYADLQNVSIEERSKVFEKLLEFTGLSSFTTRLAKALSGGMKQKLGLACALLRKPALLLLDEPTVGVDPLSRRELWKMVHNLLDEGISVIWSTAYLEEAERCHSVLLLNEGELLYWGSPQGLTDRVKGCVFKLSGINNGRRKLLARVLQQENVIDGVIQGKDLRIVVRRSLVPPIDVAQLEGESALQIQPTSPRFEDAFIDILGGGPGGTSKLADNTPPVNIKAEEGIVADKLTKRFGSFTAADKICFAVPPGEIFGLLGPNGAGKSTIFKMMCGLLTPTEGRALVNGLDLHEASSQARAKIGYMAQKFSLYGNLTVKQNLEFFAGIYNLWGKKKKQVIEQMIDIFSFGPFLNEFSDTLPLGFKQRLSLSCATMHHPDVLFLDEPTSGVDPIMRREFWNHINGLVGKGVTVMVTTHFMDEAEYCDQVALIYRSKMIKMGTPDMLKEIARSAENPAPSLEDAFIKLIGDYASA